MKNFYYKYEDEYSNTYYPGYRIDEQQQDLYNNQYPYINNLQNELDLHIFYNLTDNNEGIPYGGTYSYTLPNTLPSDKNAISKNSLQQKNKEHFFFADENQKYLNNDLDTQIFYNLTDNNESIPYGSIFNYEMPNVLQDTQELSKQSNQYKNKEHFKNPHKCDYNIEQFILCAICILILLLFCGTLYDLRNPFICLTK